MTGRTGSRDLFVLAADLDLSNALGGLLSRPASLDIRPVVFDIERHPYRDSGCRIEAVEYLRPYRRRYRRALVVFDRHGCGSSLPREGIERSVEERLGRNGWDGRAKVIVIDPELEVWVWGDAPAVARVLGWGGQHRELRRWLHSRRLWSAGHLKPADPKKAMLEAMRQKRTKVSARRFSELAGTMDFGGCQDPAFVELAQTLRTWFPVGVPE